MKSNLASFLGKVLLPIGGLVVHLVSCVSIPKGATAVTPFEQTRYLGTWYEIARMDLKFERGLEKVTAEYSLRKENVVRVVNKGYKAASKEWKTAIGKAKFVGSANEGRLKVSFFGPFYSGYNIIALDSGYKYALIAGNNTNYLWLLSRDKRMPESIRDNYLQHAAKLGYDTSRLIWTKQD